MKSKNFKERSSSQKNKSSAQSHLSAWRSPPKKNKKSWGRFFFKWTSILFIWGVVATFFLVLFFSYDFPDLDKFESAMRRPAIIIKARDGKIVATYGDLTGRTVMAEHLPDHVSNALLAVEDARFYSHFGVDIVGLIRAAYANHKAGHVVQGGSTITQQLAKNFLQAEGLFTINDRSFRRKIQEVILAIWLEYRFSKDQILTLYLNRVYFGAGTYGLTAASAKYFGKDPQHLTVYESAVLAGILKAPSRYSPQNSPEMAYERAQVVLKRMVEAGFLRESEREACKTQKSYLLSVKKSSMVGRYFCDWIVDEVGQYIGALTEDVVVETTLDLSLQDLAEKSVDQSLEELSKKFNARQAALVSMTPSGAVRALVGGRDYRESQFNRATQAQRQPGSAFKLFVFLAALDKGMSLNERISDMPITFSKWNPKNYAWKSRGTISLEQAFAYSVNTSAVRLAKFAGRNAIAKTAQNLGIRTPQPKDLSIALGTGGTTLLDLTTSFAVVDNHGFRVRPYGIISIKTRSGKILYRNPTPPNIRLVDKEKVAALLRYMQAVMAYGTGKSIKLSRPCAGKTGTTQNYKDSCFVGFTPDLITGVWMGNDDNTLTIKGTGGALAGKLWFRFMEAAHKGRPVRNF